MPGFWIAAAVAAVASAYESDRSRKAQHKAIDQERKMAAAQNLRERKQAYRQMLIQRAQMQAAGVNLGVSSSSGVQGGIASLGASTASNIGFQNQLGQMNDQRLHYLDKAANLAGNAELHGAASNFFSGYAKSQG